MQELFGRVGLYVEVAGVLLAILSFSGASTRIEQVLARLRDDFRRNAPLLRHGLSSFLPTWGNIKLYGLEALWESAALLAVIIIAMQFDPRAQAALASAYSVILPWAIWKIILLAMFAVPVLYMAWAAAYFVTGVIVLILMSVLWRIFWLLSRPPSGIMGSIGLLLALSSPLLRLLQSLLA